MEDTADRRPSVDLDLSLSKAFRDETIDIADLEAVRMVLRGRSLIDVDRLHFRSKEAVRRHLMLLCYDVTDPQDLYIVDSVMREAISHLEVQHGYSVPEPIANFSDPTDLFLWASEPDSPYFQPALMVLKVSHVIFHIRARSLRHQLPVSDNELFNLARERVLAFGQVLRSSGVDLTNIEAGEKPRRSQILKLLAKRETLAAQLHDRIRFRIIIKNASDMLPTLLLMTQKLFPPNYVVPDGSRNDLVSFKEMLETMNQQHPGLESIRDALLRERNRTKSSFHNEFSHPDFRMINFVVDLPLRIDRYATRASSAALNKFGRVVFTMAEFQVFDLDTFVSNEQGPGSHAHYKARQRRAVLRRLVGNDAVEAWCRPNTDSDDA
ncbi:MAG: TIGR04552 family protein [Myxococcales bacterium]|nr:TIGR04552 family protein [Myxococcales bacterium]|tara:strand:- start:18 stop:1157 length:1140 start_codon:yes stop_codon:yes gene_type:complete